MLRTSGCKFVMLSKKSLLQRLRFRSPSVYPPSFLAVDCVFLSFVAEFRFSCWVRSWLNSKFNRCYKMKILAICCNPDCFLCNFISSRPLPQGLSGSLFSIFIIAYFLMEKMDKLKTLWKLYIKIDKNTKKLCIVHKMSKNGTLIKV